MEILLAPVARFLRVWRLLNIIFFIVVLGPGGPGNRFKVQTLNSFVAHPLSCARGLGRSSTKTALQERQSPNGLIEAVPHPPGLPRSCGARSKQARPESVPLLFFSGEGVQRRDLHNVGVKGPTSSNVFLGV